MSRVRRTTRRHALRKGLAFAAGAPLAAAGPMIDPAGALAARTDAQILAQMLDLEVQLELAYEAAAESGLLQAEVEEAARQFAVHQHEHAGAIRAALADMGAPARAGKQGDDGGALDELSDQGALGSQGRLLESLVDLERAIVDRWNDASTELTRFDLLRTGAQIACNAGQHLVVLRQQLGKDPVGGSFGP